MESPRGERWSRREASEEERGLKKLYVGNLPYSATEAELRELFSQFGDVHAVNLISDRETGRPRGFCFIEMDEPAAEAAVSSLDGQDFGGRNLRVNEARERSGERRGSW